MLEILAPAGNETCALAAINNGANAIYLGLSSFSARQNADNFDEAAFHSVIEKAHFCGVKVYVAMNTIVKDAETEAFIRSLLRVWGEGADAIILQDALLGKAIHRRYPDIILHLSTQAGVCTLSGAKFAKECGFSRVILARETPLSEIKKIAEFIETEVFVQGALCACFSGQCYFSSFAGGNSGNRGRCKQPCRKRYSYNRKDTTEKSYALSLSDLSVGEDIEKLIAAGVVSFKIEGRMRRSEYVAAAVRYYRAVLDKTPTAQKALSDLKRTYNRGNYTKGLAFGQDKRFLSPAVQGHIGEKVGVVKVENGKFYVESIFKPKNGDAFKILRDGVETGGAVYLKTEGKRFIIGSKNRLKNGDGVFVTTDTEVNERVLNVKKHGQLTVRLFFRENELPKAELNGVTFVGEEYLQSAQNRALTEEELIACFSKTDGLPVNIIFEKIEIRGSIFIPKSKLNEFRRRAYAALSDEITSQGRVQSEYEAFDAENKISGKNEKVAVIADDFTDVKTDIAIYKPSDFTKDIPKNFINGTFEKYLYYPAYMDEKDENRFAAWIKTGVFDGLYTENYSGIIFAKRYGVTIFAGTGLNLINSISVNELLKDDSVRYYVISKEANVKEIEPLCGEKAFVLSSGNIKVMDFVYCPFGKTCCVCDKKDEYSLTDENGRKFSVKRYLSADEFCRFEIYNCADLIGCGVDKAGQLLDLTLVKDRAAAVKAKDNESRQKEIYQNYTSGHFKRGVE